MHVDIEGTVFQRGDGASPEVFATLGEVTTVPPLNPSRNMRDKTSINDSQFQYSPGMKQGGTPTVDIRYDPDDASHVAIIEDFESKTAANYKIVLPDSPATEIDFRAFVSGYTGPTGDPDGMVTLSIQLQIIDGPTWSNV